MTFKERIDEAKAAKRDFAEAARIERIEKADELKAIADRLEQHLIAQAPAEVGLQMQREDGKISLQSADYVIVVEAGFTEYTAAVLVGEPRQAVLGSQHRLATLDDVDAYILGIVQSH